jgi:hypothetical protein
VNFFLRRLELFFSRECSFTRGLFHFRRAAFSATLKAKVGSTLTKAASLRITLNI